MNTNERQSSQLSIRRLLLGTNAAIKLSILTMSIGLCTIGCQKTPAEKAQKDAENRREEAADRVEKNADKAAERVEEAGDKAAERIRNAGAAAESKADKVEGKVEDSALTAKVKSALIAEPGISALAIDVESRDHVVTLYGTVDTETNRLRAATVASSVDGVRSVDNKLVIKK